MTDENDRPDQTRRARAKARSRVTADSLWPCGLPLKVDCAPAWGNSVQAWRACGRLRGEQGAVVTSVCWRFLIFLFGGADGLEEVNHTNHVAGSIRSGRISMLR